MHQVALILIEFIDYILLRWTIKSFFNLWLSTTNSSFHRVLAGTFLQGLLRTNSQVS